jgi:response regulator RpfG family c-di-GMP phosphodiesterase
MVDLGVEINKRADRFKHEDIQRNSSILVVDDEIHIVNMVQELLETANYDVIIVQSGKAAIEACNLRSFKLVISDMRMPGMDGTGLLRVLAHDYPSMRRVILTGYVDAEQTIAAINLGRVHRFLMKPINARDLVTAVAEELEIGERERAEITRLRRVIDKLAEEF